MRVTFNSALQPERRRHRARRSRSRERASAKSRRAAHPRAERRPVGGRRIGARAQRAGGARPLRREPPSRPTRQLSVDGHACSPTCVDRLTAGSTAILSARKLRRSPTPAGGRGQRAGGHPGRAGQRLQHETPAARSSSRARPRRRAVRAPGRRNVFGLPGRRGDRCGCRHRQRDCRRAVAQRRLDRPGHAIPTTSSFSLEQRDCGRARAGDQAGMDAGDAGLLERAFDRALGRAEPHRRGDERDLDAAGAPRRACSRRADAARSTATKPPTWPRRFPA